MTRAPTNVRDTTSGNSKWWYYQHPKEYNGGCFVDLMLVNTCSKFVWWKKMSCMAFKLKFSSTFVKGQTSKWMNETTIKSQSSIFALFRVSLNGIEGEKKWFFSLYLAKLFLWPRGKMNPQRKGSITFRNDLSIAKYRLWLVHQFATSWMHMSN